MFHAVCAGRLGTEIEERVSKSGNPYKYFRIAVNRRSGGQEETTWIRCMVFSPNLFKLIASVKKGSVIICSGDVFSIDPFMNREGEPSVSVTMSVHSIDFAPLPPKGEVREEEKTIGELYKEMSQPVTEGAFEGSASGDEQFYIGYGQEGKNKSEDIPF